MEYFKQNYCKTQLQEATFRNECNCYFQLHQLKLRDIYTAGANEKQNLSMEEMIAITIVNCIN